MPIVCIVRPNRTKRRPFTERDLERIARSMSEDGVKDEEILSSVAVSTDNVFLLCIASKALGTVLSLVDDIGDAEDLAALLVTLKATKVSVDRWGARIPFVGRFAKVVSGVLTLFEKITERLLVIVSTIDELGKIQSKMAESCVIAEKRVKQLLDSGSPEKIGISDLKNLINPA